MSSYRFCRTDDIPLLVHAWNRCGLPHFPGAPPLTIAGFKQEIRELDLWCSSCMVAFDAKEPVGVLIGCKRPPQTHVLRIAVHPDHLRRGHGRHMLTSLSAKLAILGPPQLVAEIPADNAAARALFKSCGWRDERTYVDFVSETRTGSPAPPGLVLPVTVNDLEDIALPAGETPRAWERTRGTLIGRKDRLRGLAVVSGESLDASVLYARDDHGRVEIWCLHAQQDAAGKAALGVLLNDLRHSEPGLVAVPRVSSSEASFEHLSSLKFRPDREAIGVVAQATPA